MRQSRGRHWPQVFEGPHVSTRRQYPKVPRVAVGAVVIHQGRVLMVRRAQSPSRGRWSVPGGVVELGESLQQAAEREVFEETGIRIRALKPVFTFDHIHRDDQGRIAYHYVVIDLAAEYLSGEPVPGDDAAEAGWLTPAELDRLPVGPRTLKMLSCIPEWNHADKS